MTRSANTTTTDLEAVLRHNGLLLVRFARRYGLPILALIASAVIGWMVAASVSDYTKGGWEIHFIQRGIGLNLHFHHWYYGIPLGLLAFATIEWHPVLSIFLFGMGETLAAHSFVNEHGIPSILEGGATWPVSPEIYFPIVTALALLYAAFIVRKEEWLLRAKEREEIAASYLCPRTRTNEVLRCLDDWAVQYMTQKKSHVDRDTDIRYSHWRGLDRPQHGEWQLDYVLSPFDDQLKLLVVRLHHVPLQGRAGELDERIRELDKALQPLAQPAVAGPEEALQAISQLKPEEGTKGNG